MNIRKLITFIFLLCVFGFLFWNIQRNWSEIVNFPWQFSFGKLFLVLVFLLPVYFLNSFSWYLIMHSLGSNISYLRSFKIWVFSNFGRFVPGVIWQYAGRVYFSSKAGIPKTITISAIALESILLILVNSIIALIFFLLMPNKEQLNQYKIFFTLVSLVTLGIFFSGLYFIHNNKYIVLAINFFQKITKRNFKIKKIKMDRRYLPPIICNFFLQFIVAGLVLFFLLQFAINLPPTSLPIFIGIYVTSWLLGYLAIFAPSGLGVQEITMAGLLSFYVPFPVASLIAILFRISLMISETFALLFGILIFRRDNKKI